MFVEHESSTYELASCSRSVVNISAAYGKFDYLRTCLSSVYYRTGLASQTAEIAVTCGSRRAWRTLARGTKSWPLSAVFIGPAIPNGCTASTGSFGPRQTKTSRAAGYSFPIATLEPLASWRFLLRYALHLERRIDGQASPDIRQLLLSL